MQQEPDTLNIMHVSYFKNNMIKLKSVALSSK